MSNNFSLRSCDLGKLNSMTKYPNIPTYHTLGERGALLGETVSFEGEVIHAKRCKQSAVEAILILDRLLIF